MVYYANLHSKKIILISGLNVLMYYCEKSKSVLAYKYEYKLWSFLLKGK